MLPCPNSTNAATTMIDLACFRDKERVDQMFRKAGQGATAGFHRLAHGRLGDIVEQFARHTSLVVPVLCKVRDRPAHMPRWYPGD